ncbi:triphosphoribosyl-dephospho-CoA synthase [Methylomonas sp. EFPC3]|uniref:triphosphoribosyl-dephospho-CoA synthase n=1 Tax=Methylomonas sp. EFPC3 TaxID=3021710 RepID=UPI002416F17F|nr:triphosphoribosyl-dephospho-CoA synthase [Methylomonas sp. EFPC3]WFP51653.1 triphosphoribosyl-dephospho-CoA synthase [Methylomonas sp. EFPC3]
MLNRQQLIDAYRQACEIELQAFKPGNVSIYSPAHDMTVDDFRLSAQVSSGPLTDPKLSLGEKIYYAIKATREAVACNTNLGIVLLCAPLIQAAASLKPGQSWRQALECVLQATTQADADWVFEAIVLAAPAGLGESEQHDVQEKAAVTLMEAMRFAADKDRIALQYATNFKDIFDFSVLRYNRAFVLSGDSGWAALAVFAAMLAHFPDSHIERKYGKRYSEWIKVEMESLDQAMQLAIEPEELFPVLYGLDKAFKAQRINPGTTADMTVATVLVVLLEQLIGQQRAGEL